jgi:hypothetical protein
MATLKISELPSYAAADGDDLLPVVDVVNGATKHITRDVLIEMVGRWDDLVVPGVSVNPTGIASAMTLITNVDGWLGCWLAVNTGTPTIVFAFQLSHMTDLTKDVRPHVHWVKCDSSDNAGTVVWRARFRHLPLNGVATAWSAYGNGSLSLDPGDAADKGALTTWTLDAATYASGGVWGISDIILMTLQRNGGTSGDAAVVSADLHYQKARFGSVNEASL